MFFDTNRYAHMKWEEQLIYGSVSIINRPLKHAFCSFILLPVKKQKSKLVQLNTPHYAYL